MSGSFQPGEILADTYRVERDLGATSIGGRQRVVWPADEQEMLLTGPAEVICRGEVELA